MEPQSYTVIGETNHRNRLRKFYIKPDDRRRHMYVLGKTGMGKTDLLKNLAISDIQGGHGMCYIDPHGDAAEDLLNYIPPHRINDVVLFDPADLDYPIAFNVMESVNPRYKHLVASGLVAVFKKMWMDSWGPRLEYILRNTILALIDFPSATLLGIPRMYVDKKYRRKVVSKITDPIVKSFWVDEFEGYAGQFSTEAVAPIQNKVGQFLSSSIIRNVVGQTTSTIDLREIMDNRKILIVNLAKGKVGEDISAMLGAMLVTKLQLAAMSRANVPEDQRPDFYLYVDEFQNFATSSFATILSEARKYHLNLVIAHQYINQLEEDIRDAVFGNVGTLALFRVGAEDADFLEGEFAPQFEAINLVNLPKFQIYVKLMIDGVASQPFSANTLAIPYPRYDLTDTIIRVSRERYTNPRAVVEEKIMRWSGVEIESIASAVGEGETMLETGVVVPSEKAAQPAPLRQTATAKPKSILSADEDAERTVVTLPSEIEKTKEKEAKAREKAIKEGRNPDEPDDRPRVKAVCADCGIPIELPFVPDPTRPVFCKDCLADFRSRQSRKENYDKEGEELEKPEARRTERREAPRRDAQVRDRRDDRTARDGRARTDRRDQSRAPRRDAGRRDMPRSGGPRSSAPRADRQGSPNRGREPRREQPRVPRSEPIAQQPTPISLDEALKQAPRPFQKPRPVAQPSRTPTSQQPPQSTAQPAGNEGTLKPGETVQF